MYLAPRALVHASLGQRPREKLLPKRALKARIKAAFASIPHIASRENDENRMPNAESILSWNDETIRSRVPQRFCVQVAADRCNVGVHARPNVAVQPRFTIFGAEDNMNDDLAKRLRITE